MTIETVKEFINKLPEDDELNDVRIRTKDGDFYVKFIDYERDSKTNEKYLVLGVWEKTN